MVDTMTVKKIEMNVDNHVSFMLFCNLFGRWPFLSLYFRTVLLSIISLLNEPNTFSPANVDASVMYRRWKDSNGKDKEYENIVRLVQYISKPRHVDIFYTITSD